MALDNSVVYAAVGTSVRMFKRGKQTREWTGHGGCVHTMLLLGSQLVVVDETNCLRVLGTGMSRDEWLVREITLKQSVIKI